MTVILFPDGVWALSLPLISLCIIGILILINKKFLKYLSCWNVHLFEMLNCFGNVVKCCQKQVQMQYDSEVSVLAYLKKNDLWKSDLKKEKKRKVILINAQRTFSIVLRSQLLKVFWHIKILISRILRAGICFGK